MAVITDDPNDPRIKRGAPDETPVPMSDAYLVLSKEEIAKGFVRPYRDEYKHVGSAGPKHELRDLTAEEHERYDQFGYVKFEAYPEGHASGASGRFWTRAKLDAVGKGCGTTTTMNPSIAATYAREPTFYGATYCVHCRMHRPVGESGEFVWMDGSRVGT